MAPGSFRFIGVHVEMGDRHIQQQQEQDSGPESHHRRHKGEMPQGRTFFQGRDQKAPDRGRHHDPGGKTGQSPLDIPVELFFHEIDTAGSQAGPKKGNQDPLPDICTDQWVTSFLVSPKELK